LIFAKYRIFQTDRLILWKIKIFHKFFYLRLKMEKYSKYKRITSIGNTVLQCKYQIVASSTMVLFVGIVCNKQEPRLEARFLIVRYG
jgi:hypothetical protein